MLLSKPIYLPEVVKQSYIPSLDGFRAISILLVIVGHFCMRTTNPILRLVSTLGSYGVFIFFVISGFLITTLLLKEQVNTGSISLKGFYIRRALRILPVAYLFVFVVFLLNLIFKMRLPVGAFLRPLFFTENFSSHSDFTPMGHFWSLSVEEQFYLIFPFIISKNLKAYVRVAVILIVLILILPSIYSRVHLNQPMINAALYFLYVVFGKGISAILIGLLSTLIILNLISDILSWSNWLCY
jgi:peptidoglycan/LPS O-acetylase OafA/YrhL